MLTAALITAYLVRHYIFTLTVLRKIKKHRTDALAAILNYEPTVSILIPAHNEENVIERLLQRMTELAYPQDKLQIIVIDDASSDRTGQIAEEYSKRCKHITVLHRGKEDGGRGKASALNFGLKHATGEIVLCFDADYYPQKTA